MSYRVHHSGDLTNWLNDRLQAVRGPGSKRFADNVSMKLKSGNQVDRLRGVDRFGRPLYPVLPRTGYYRGETGPPLAPHGMNSDCVRGYFAEVRRTSIGWVCTAGIRSAKAAIFVYHALGRGRYGLVPVRDILGTTPKTQGYVRASFREHADGMFKKPGYRG